ncbi:MAG: hypothetical protein R3E87_00725 [Burkholderiaceae bacterium]
MLDRNRSRCAPVGALRKMLWGLLLGWLALPVLAQDEPIQLHFSARLERGADGQPLPPGLPAGTVVHGTIELRSDTPLPIPPDLLVGGRAWNRSFIRVLLGAPLNARFEHGQITQSDGLLVFSHDPLGSRDYSLREMLSSSGPPLKAASAGDSLSPAQFAFMQRGHPDQNRPLASLIAAMGGDARMLLRYRGADARASPLSLVFGVFDIRKPTASVAAD